MGGYKTPDVFAKDLITLNTTNTTNLNNIEKMLVKHRNAYTPEAPIEDVYSRAYSGIIIDARGKLHFAHGAGHAEILPSDVCTIRVPNGTLRRISVAAMS